MLAEEVAGLGGFSWEAAIDAIRSSRACLISNPGNAGDALIALGTFHALRSAGISLEIVSHTVAHEKDYDLFVYSGGGNLIPLYEEGLRTLEACAATGKQIIVLPHTTFGYEDKLRKIAGNLRILCREYTSLRRLVDSGFPEERVGLADDMALSVNESFFDDARCQDGRGQGYVFRTDQESAKSSALPQENRDISLSWNGDLWHNEYFVGSVCESLAFYLVQYETIHTDRLHVAILASMLQRQVKLYENSYYKNREVFYYSLRSRYPNLELIERHMDMAGADQREVDGLDEALSADQLISRYVKGMSFADVGGLWGTVNERVTAAIKSGASSAVMIDEQPLGNEWWVKFHAHAQERGCAGCYEFVEGNLDDETLVDRVGRFDFVHCSGIIYHVPSPFHTLLRLRNLTKKYLILGSMTVPTLISTEFGQIDMADGAAYFLPALSGRRKEIFKRHFEELQVFIHNLSSEDLHPWLCENGTPNHSLWWWVWTAETLGRMAESAGFEVISVHEAWSGRAHNLFLRVRDQFDV